MKSQLGISPEPSDEDADIFLVAWHCYSCEDAVVSFSEMKQCPVCYEYMNEDGVIIHKDPKVLVN